MNKSINSFLKADNTGIKVLVLVPHEDDEINIAGSFIYYMRATGAEVFVVYATNGDSSVRAEIRLREATNALKVLGIDQTHIIVMGYGDSPSGETGKHIFYEKFGKVIAQSGHAYTYGANGYLDYSFEKRKRHNEYNRVNYCEDLKSIILDVCADVILCVDYDSHADHRMLSLSFDAVMGEILSRKDNTYFPEVYKTFAYSLSYFSYDDLQDCNNILSVKYPQPGKLQTYSNEVIDTSGWSWEYRKRFPVHEHCRENVNISLNVIVKALAKYKSQRALLHTGEIVNGDSVYWRRRTDSISYQADSIVSSGNKKYLNDYKLVNSVDLTSCEYNDYIWTPLDETPYFEYVWENEKDVSLICIYGNVHGRGRILRLGISFSDGFYMETGALPEKGRPLEIELEIHHVSWCRIQILEACGEEYGIAECEVYESKDAISCLQPFIKIVINDDFAYEYYFTKNEKVFDFSVYKFGIDAPATCEIIKGSGEISDGILRLTGDEKEYIIKASIQGTSISDTIIFKKVDAVYKIRKFFGKKLWQIRIKSIYFYNWLCMIRGKIKQILIRKQYHD